MIINQLRVFNALLHRARPEKRATRKAAGFYCMKKSLPILIVGLFWGSGALSQQTMAPDSVFQLLRPAVTAGVQLPLGNFAVTHYPGLSVNYSRNLSRKPVPFFSHKWVGLSSQFGITAWPGKKQRIGNGQYRYGIYSMGYVQAGINWIPVKKMAVSLFTGPAAGYYSRTVRVAVTGMLQTSWQISTNLYFRPSAGLWMETKTNALWTAGVQLGYMF